MHVSYVWRYRTFADNVACDHTKTYTTEYVKDNFSDERISNATFDILKEISVYIS